MYKYITQAKMGKLFQLKTSINLYQRIKRCLREWKKFVTVEGLEPGA